MRKYCDVVVAKCTGLCESAESKSGECTMYRKDSAAITMALFEQAL